MKIIQKNQFYVVPYNFNGLVLFAVEDVKEYIEKYCNTKEDALNFIERLCDGDIYG